MGDYDVLKVLSLATLLWALFFLNLVMPDLLKNSAVNPVLWSVFYVLLLVPALITTLILIAESIKNMKNKRLHHEA